MMRVTVIYEALKVTSRKGLSVLLTGCTDLGRYQPRLEILLGIIQVI